jgi:two-component system NarL family response regulator
MTYEETGNTLGLTERTIRYHMGEIIQQLHLKNRSQVIAYAARMGLTRNHNTDTE